MVNTDKQWRRPDEGLIRTHPPSNNCLFYTPPLNPSVFLLAPLSSSPSYFLFFSSLLIRSFNSYSLLSQTQEQGRRRRRGRRKKIQSNQFSFLGIKMNITLSYSLILILFSVLFIAISASEELPRSIYDVLKSHGLPMGLLPKGVKEFSLDEKGRFEVYLEQSCNAKFENEVHYERNVSGMISYGQIGALSGISAQELFLWFPVKGIRVDIPSSGLIYFDVGVIYKQFSLSLFETPPDCKAVDRVAPSETLVREGQTIAATVSKSQSRKLGFKLDQENLQRAVL